jgi:hypothetical protein
MRRERDYSIGVQGACRSAGKARQHALAPVTRGAIEVDEFTPRQRSLLIESRIFASVGCAAVSTVLHLALLTSIVWPASRERIHAHPPEGVGASRSQAADDIALQWVAVDERSAADGDRATQPALPPRLISIAVNELVPELAANLPDVAPDEAHTAVANDSDSSAQVYGRYLGQINARIDRAWVRPRAPIGATRFLCQVRIEQDAVGNVREVTLDRCNGSPVWQRSLVDAIKSASPLPAPADPAVFASEIQMAFREEAPEAEVMGGQLLPSAAAVKQSINSAGAATSIAAFRRFRDTSAHSGATSAIDLRIEGRATQQGHRPSTAESQPSERLTIGVNAKPVDAGEAPEQKQYH